MPVKYIGRKTDFLGKTLWEIVGNLKDFGVNRVVVRSRFERYPEPSYLRIRKVEALANEDPRKVRVWAEKVFRGCKYPRLVEVCSASYKTDYRLIPKEEEAAYCKEDSIVPFTHERKVLPSSCEFPPLLKEMIMRDIMASGGTVKEAPKMQLKFKGGRDQAYCMAKDGEKPTVEFKPGVGKPVCDRLYAEVQY